jgi:hypothetical protein
MKTTAEKLINKTEESYGLPPGALNIKTSLGRPAKAFNNVSLSEMRKALILYIIDEIGLRVTTTAVLLNLDHSSVSYLLYAGRHFYNTQDQKFIGYYQQVQAAAELITNQTNTNAYPSN